MAKGDFTPTRLVEIQAKIENTWNQPQFDKYYKIKGESVKAVIENQTASFPELKDPSKEREIAVKWGDFCDNTAVITVDKDTCDNQDCDEVDPKTKTYKPDTFIRDCFTITEEDYQTSVLDKDTVIQMGQLKSIRNIMEKLNTATIAKIDANKGGNPFLDDYTEEDGDTLVPRSEFNIETMFPYFLEVLENLRSNNAYILDGSNLFQARILAMAKQANADQKTDAELWDYFNYYNDLKGFIDAGVPRNTYLIDNGALAIQTRQKYPKVPREYKDYTKYSIAIPGYPGLGLDVKYQQTCVDGSEVYSWQYKIRALIAVNPFRCSPTNTGITSFRRIANA